MATLAEFQAAMTAFVASPTVATRRALCGAYLVLPETVTADGVSTKFQSFQALEEWANGELENAGVTSAPANPARFIRTQCGYQ